MLASAGRGARRRPSAEGSSCSPGSSPAAELSAAAAALAEVGPRARPNAVRRARVAAFSSPSPGEDVVRLVDQQDADLLLLSFDGDPLGGPPRRGLRPGDVRRRLTRRARRAAASRADRRSLRRLRARLGCARARRLGGGGARSPAATRRGGRRGPGGPRSEPHARGCVPDRAAHGWSRRGAAPRTARARGPASACGSEPGCSSWGCPIAGGRRGWERLAPLSSRRHRRRRCSCAAACGRAASLRRRRLTRFTWSIEGPRM